MTISTQNKSEMMQFNSEQSALIKNYLCKGISDDELKLFSAVCKKTGLDPFMKQIYAVKRKDQMTIQTSIDGYRLIAERTGRYSPGRESTYCYEGDKLICATSYVKKQTADGTWHEVAASAYYDEYKPTYSNQFWDSKKHIMLAKCAESLALRKCFPNELSGLYSEDEMAQASNGVINDSQAEELNSLFDKCSIVYQSGFNKWLSKKEVNSIYSLPESLFLSVKNGFIKNISEQELNLNSEVMNDA